MSEAEVFEEVKNSINEALEEIKRQSPEIYNHLKESIIMDEKTNTFCYRPQDGEQLKVIE